MAACFPASIVFTKVVSTHSHPKVAALALLNFIGMINVSTHSHPKVAAYEFEDFLSG